MKYFVFLFFLSTCFLQAQVGVGTTNPTKDLDINGELRIRNVPTSTNSTDVLTVDTDGNVQKFETFLLSEVNSLVATNNVDFTTPDGTVDNVDLNLSTTVTIPANTEAIVIITYSVPMGIPSGNNTNGYYGIRFLRNTIEAPQGSRKSSIVNNMSTVNMVTISNTYTENFTPSTTDRVITYTLNGYIEQTTNQNRTYRFNMWAPTGPNFNWGRATLTKKVFIK